MKKALVIPHHHDNLDFLKEWPSFETEFDTIYIILDRPLFKGFDDNLGWSNLKFYDHKSIDGILGKNSWIIPRKDSSIRSFGYWLAWKEGHDIIFTLDNDCKPINKEDDYWVREHERILNKTRGSKWWPTGPEHTPRTRGVPYDLLPKSEKIMLSHGTWTKNPDYDAIHAVSKGNNDGTSKKDYISMKIPNGYYYPMCGMNLAWNAEITPLMYFGLQGPEYPYSRFDDIWAGLFSKKVMDHLRMGVYTGLGIIEHSRQSNPYDNLIKEAPGIKINETLWQRIDAVVIPQEHDTPVEAYEWLITHINFEGLDNPHYWKKLQEATLKWLELYK